MYDLVVTVTDIDLDYLNFMGNHKPARVAPFGMYDDIFLESGDGLTGSFDLSYIGALDWMPNIEALDWFIDNVWFRIRKDHPELKFFVAGRNAKKSYAKYLSECGINYLGEVENAGKFLSGSGIVIVPLFSGSGIRVRIIEAMFAGKPIVATSAAVSGIPVEDGKNILIADDDQEFADCIEKLISDREYSHQLGRNARMFSHTIYDNRVLSEELASFYKLHLL